MNTRTLILAVLILAFGLEQAQAQIPYGTGTLNRRRCFTAQVTVTGQNGVGTAAVTVNLPAYSKMIAVCPDGDTGSGVMKVRAILIDTSNSVDLAAATATCNKAIPIRESVLRGIDGEGNRIILTAPDNPNTDSITVNIEAYY